ncbi:unnamed protein product [Prorocentrum cordatum]|uniref:SAP domain-containing protein n=1 Tax=Prorocentrum cordatum TaxID=2364126 RepID=A0ABN9PWD7_9DINO|nr:unnamed protein product [Polarella glacialis]
MQRCIEDIASSLAEDTACERLMMADLLGLADLRLIVLQFIGSSRERLANIQVTEGYSRLVDQRPRLLGDILAQAVKPGKRPPPASDLPEHLDALTVAALKQLLADRGLPVGGNKAALLARLRVSAAS